MAGGRTRDYKAEYARRKARAVIRQREAKRGKPLSDSYKRRIAKALEKGKTLQAARGHKPREHVERKAREIEQLGLTRDQLRRVDEWATRRLFEIRDTLTTPAEVVEWAQANGFDAFTQYRVTWEKARKLYLKENRNGTYASRGMAYLNDLTSTAGVDDISWLYYH